MVDSRHLDWDGTYNTRDLGGLPCRDGGATAWGAIVRSDEPDALTTAGWTAVANHGVGTIIDLRGPEERTSAAKGPEAIRTESAPLDDYSRTEFWASWAGGLDCTPLYYQAFLNAFPERVAAVFDLIATAEPGGILIHCSSGRDRTGLITMVLLSLVGVEHTAIVDDYLDSGRRLEPLWQQRRLGDQNGRIEALVRSHGVTMERHLLSVLHSIDPDDVLRAGGLADDVIDAVRFRLCSGGRGAGSAGPTTPDAAP